MLELTRTQRLALGVSLAVVCLALTINLVNRRHAPPVTVSGAEPFSASAVDVAAAAPAFVTAHVVGAVNQPGLVRLAPGARIWDAINAAGGFSQAADTEALNLAASVPDGVQILVPERAAPAASQWPQPAPEGPAAPLPAAPQSPCAQDTAPVDQPGMTSAWEGQTAAAGSPSQPPQSAPRPAVGAAAASPSIGLPGLPARSGPRYPISINQADQSQLEALPGVGPALAERIARYRAANGPFQRIEDLDNVNGIGPSTLTKIAPFVTL